MTEQLAEREVYLEQIATPELPQELVRMQSRAVQAATELEINTAEDYAFSFAMRQSYTSTMRVITGLLEPAIADLYAAHRKATAHRANALAPFEEADAIVEQKRLAWDAKQEQIAKDEEQRRQQEIQTQRQADAMEYAADLERAGEPEAAAEVLQQAIEAPPPAVVVRPDIPETKGAVKRKDYDFRIVDENKIPRNYMTPDLKAIRGTVRSSGEKTNIPGVEVFQKKSEHVRL